MRSLREAYLALNRELVATEETHDDTAKNESRNGNSRVSSDCSRGEVHGEKRGPNTYWWRGRVGSFKDAGRLAIYSVPFSLHKIRARSPKLRWTHSATAINMAWTPASLQEASYFNPIMCRFSPCKKRVDNNGKTVRFGGIRNQWMVCYCPWLTDFSWSSADAEDECSLFEIDLSMRLDYLDYRMMDPRSLTHHLGGL